MADYPATLPTLVNATEEWLDDLETDRAVSGTVRVRVMFTAKKRVFKIKHVVTAALKTTLQSFYDTNRATTFNYTWGGTVYVCVFGSSPVFVQLNSNLAEAQLTLLEV